MYCEKDGQCPICNSQLEFDSMTYNDEYEIQRCGGCKAIALLDSYTKPTVSGFLIKQGEITVDLDGLFEYMLDYSDTPYESFQALSTVINHEPSLIPEILIKLKEIECLNKVQ